ncbi:MAG: YqgE/AlgH family protein [Chromatiales bacterium]|jgi:putative transcriptional regulator
MALTNLTNHFLIAMPGLQDPNFEKSVTYICEHSEDGAMGIVINNPLSIPVSEILEQLDIDEKASGIPDNPIYLGGPVNGERGFVLHDNDTEWDSTLRVKNGISVTTSRDILVSIASGTGPERSLIALGYAGWGSGQLEQELADNAWLAVPADKAIIFDLPPEERWNAAAAELGIDLALLSTDTGHA